MARLLRFRCFPPSVPQVGRNDADRISTASPRALGDPELMDEVDAPVHLLLAQIGRRTLVDCADDRNLGMDICVLDSIPPIPDICG